MKGPVREQRRERAEGMAAVRGILATAAIYAVIGVLFVVAWLYGPAITAWTRG